MCIQHFLIVYLEVTIFSILYHCPPLTKAERLIFPHENCESATINQQSYEMFYSLQKFKQSDGTIVLNVKFKGVADAYVALTQSENSSLPHYVILFGTYNNQKSEIRKSVGGLKFQSPIQSMSTPGILPQFNYRGFSISYHRTSGAISVISEGDGVPLLSWQDPQPLSVAFFSFSTWRNRVVMVAFNCHPSELNSSHGNRSGLKDASDYYLESVGMPCWNRNLKRS